VTEIVADLFISIVRIIQGLQDSGACGNFASALLCAYTFPGCNFESSQLLPICPEKCTEINAQFESCRAILNDGVLDLIPNLRVLLENFDCFNTSTYFSVPPQLISDEFCSNLSEYLCTSIMHTNLFNVPTLLVEIKSTALWYVLCLPQKHQL